MNLVTALAIVIGVLAVVATYLCLGTPFGLMVWALFIGWGSFFHSGGKEDGLKNSAMGHIWGAIVAAIALIIIGQAGMGVIGNSVIVGVTVFIMVMGAHIPLLSTIPAAVYGYASTAAACLLTAGVVGDTTAVIKTAVMVVISLIIGNVFGYVSEKGAGAIAASS